MPKLDLRNTIKKVVHSHLKEKKYYAMGQCLTAVGWVGGTLPELYEKDGMIELSMADVAGAGFVVGAALQGKRPIYIIRYQGFNWYNAPMIVNYACKSKEMWGRSCPIFIRSIAMEGGIGPSAGSSHHTLYYRMPGIKMYSPMTPKEYKLVYNKFLNDDSVYYVSEHRGAYPNNIELKDIEYTKPDAVIISISITRFSAIKASNILKKKYGIKASIFNLMQIKPFKLKRKIVENISRMKNKIVFVTDDDYENGLGQNIGFEISNLTNAKIKILAVKERTAGFHPKVDNLPPDCSKIVKEILKEVRK